MTWSRAAWLLSDALIDAHDDHLGILPMRSAVVAAARFSGEPGLDLHAGAVAPRVRPDPGGRRAPLHRLERGRSPSLGRCRGSGHHRGMTGERAVLRAREVLEAGGVPLLGLAETFV